MEPETDPNPPKNAAYWKRRAMFAETWVRSLERDIKGWEDECRLFLGQRDKYREALIEANEETKLYPGHEGRWGKLLGDA